jgi:Carbohydrate-selective porin, OprB family/S-layer homology domain
MELSVKYLGQYSFEELESARYIFKMSLRQTPKLFIGSLFFFSIYTQLCLPSLANSLPESPLATRNDATAQAPIQSIVTQVSPPEMDLVSPSFVPRLEPGNAFIPSLEGGTGTGKVGSVVAVEPESTDINPDTLNTLPTVSELADVKPTDWAYQALKSVMERYGILSAYPDRKFRGNQAMTRYEYAAALAATLDKFEDLLANAIGDEYIRQDAITLRRLQKEFGAALNDLQLRIDTIEVKAAQLEADQFSTTTKLQGQQIVGLTGGGSASNTVVSRTRLNLLTSFNKKDLLVTQLESGNNGGDAVSQEQREGFNLLGSNGLFANAGGLDYTDVESNLKLRRLYYTFSPADSLAVTVGAKMSPRDFIDKNSYANNEAVDFSSGVFLNNPLIIQNQIDRAGGAGAAIVWNPKNSKFVVRSLYIASLGDQPNQGISGDNHQASVEVEYAPTNKLKLKLQYTNALVNSTDINAVGVNAEYALNRSAGVFGRVGFGSYEGFNTTINRDLDAHPLSWAVGLGLRNLVIPGTLAGIAIGQPFVTEDLGNATQTNFEAFYNLPLNDNISITPVFSVVTNPDNDKSNGTIWQSTLRTVFSF